ncbi:MAG: rhodanese-related sulfurtransferase [Sphingobium sp.]|nr:rhodanese-related sulfurtransferase [Sphingobium sp.]MCP5400639.1 rhodanese-related sulfurtransferase [Sphingomonas sp.]
MDEISDAGHSDLCVAALYKFVTFPDPTALRAELADLCIGLDLRGTLIVAGEGINGTISGTGTAITALVDALRALPGCADMDVKYSHAKTQPFGRMKVKLKREIVTLGMDGVDPVGNVGTYVEPRDWNALISDPDTIVIDTRNDYEYGIGTFSGAINPETHSFREFPQWFEQARQQWEEGGKGSVKIAMFCTGGIRCEKSTAMARAMGCEDVYHLKGGILRYLEEVPEAESLWRGNCFVFDDRVSVTHGLALTDDVTCQDCGRPYNRNEDHSCEANGDWH